ncbi:MAG: hypothetical protein IVW36_08575 [Dehalococcoidia bacterium]|nr:hypothetical protein [Dehalococcoidia bacterium]
MRVAVFVIALLLLTGSLEPSRAPLIALTVLAGLAALGWRPWRPFDLRVVPETRLATFVLAALLLAGVIDPTRGWLSGLTIAAGLAMLTAPTPAFCGRSRSYTRCRQGDGGCRRAWSAGWDGGEWR